MIRELDELTEAAIKDNSYQQTPIGREVRQFLQALRFGGASENTIITYEPVLARLALRFPEFEGGEGFCGDDGIAYLRDFLHRHWGEAAIETRRNRLAVLRSFFKWLVEEKGLPYNPASRIRSPRSRETARVAHSESEVVKLVTRQDSLRDGCALALFARLGLRKNDVRMLQIRDIDLTRDLVWLRHRKGGDDLILPIEYKDLRDDLYLHLQGDHRQPAEYLLYPRSHRHRPMDPSSLHRWFKRCLERAELPDFPLHELRHTAGDELYRRTGNIVIAQQLLGHKSLETTRRYLHPSTDDLRSAMRVAAAARTAEER